MVFYFIDFPIRIILVQGFKFFIIIVYFLEDNVFPLVSFSGFIIRNFFHFITLTNGLESWPEQQKRPVPHCRMGRTAQGAKRPQGGTESTGGCSFFFGQNQFFIFEQNSRGLSQLSFHSKTSGCKFLNRENLMSYYITSSDSFERESCAPARPIEIFSVPCRSERLPQFRKQVTKALADVIIALYR